MCFRPLQLLDDRYANAEYGIRIKARLLLYFSIVLILFLPGLLASNLLSGYTFLQKPLLIIPAESLAIICGIVLLYRGNYTIAVNCYITFMTAGLAAFIILDTYSGAATVYHTNTLYYVFAILLFAALFGSWRWLIALPALFLTFGIAYYIVMRLKLHMTTQVLRGVLIDFGFSLIFVSALCILIKKVNHSIITKLEDYNTRLKDEYGKRVDLERQIVTVEESIRRRIGQDIHDDIGQHLIAIKMRCEMLENSGGQKSDDHAAETKRVIQLIEEAMGKISRTARGLGSVRLSAENFVSSLKHLAADSKEMYGINCRLKFNRPPAVHDDLIAISLFRIAQESISNAVKHGNAKHVTLNLYTKGDELSLEIASDGKPFSNARKAKDGLGITLMKYRSDLIGGVFTIRPGDKSGTVVKCLLHNQAGNA